MEETKPAKEKNEGSMTSIHEHTEVDETKTSGNEEITEVKEKTAEIM